MGIWIWDDVSTIGYPKIGRFIWKINPKLWPHVFDFFPSNGIAKLVSALECDLSLDVSLDGLQVQCHIALRRLRLPRPDTWQPQDPGQQVQPSVMYVAADSWLAKKWSVEKHSDCKVIWVAPFNSPNLEDQGAFSTHGFKDAKRFQMCWSYSWCLRIPSCCLWRLGPLLQAPYLGPGLDSMGIPGSYNGGTIQGPLHRPYIWWVPPI